MSRKKTPTYISWKCMIQRVYNPNHKSFPDYGGLGIQVVRRWLPVQKGGYPGGFKRFLQDMGERPEGTTLGRLDSAKDYGPHNCQWENAKQQNAGLLFKGRTKYTVDGETKTLSEWARFLGLTYRTLSRRIQRGWGDEAFRRKAGERKKGPCKRSKSSVSTPEKTHSPGQPGWEGSSSFAG